MEPAGGSEPAASRRGTVATHATLLAVLLGLEQLIMSKWDVPTWSVFAYLLLVFALFGQRVLARSDHRISPLRPLTLVAVAAAVVTTVLMALPWALPGARWPIVLVWLVPIVIAGADKFAPRLPPQALPTITACLLAVVILGQFATIRQAHNRRTSARAFHDRLVQICADTAVLNSSRPTTGWIVATDSMIRQLYVLKPPDERTRKLTGYWIYDLQEAEMYWNYNNPAKRREWQDSAREDARYLGISGCGVF